MICRQLLIAFQFYFKPLESGENKILLENGNDTVLDPYNKQEIIYIEIKKRLLKKYYVWDGHNRNDLHYIRGQIKSLDDLQQQDIIDLLNGGIK